VDQSSPSIFALNVGGLWSVSCFSDLRNVNPFWIYLRSNLKLSDIAPNFGRFCPHKF